MTAKKDDKNNGGEEVKQAQTMKDLNNETKEIDQDQADGKGKNGSAGFHNKSTKLDIDNQNNSKPKTADKDAHQTPVQVYDMPTGREERDNGVNKARILKPPSKPEPQRTSQASFQGLNLVLRALFASKSKN